MNPSVTKTRFLVISFTLAWTAGAHGSTGLSGPVPTGAAIMAPGTTIGVAFTKPVLPSSATNLSNYTLSTPQPAISRATLLPDGMTVAVSLSGPLDNGSLTITNIVGIDGARTGSGALPIMNFSGFSSVDIPENDASAGLAVTSNLRDFAVQTAAAGAGGTRDSLSFVGRQSSGPALSWEAMVVPSPDAVDTQAGIMVREELAPGARNLFVSLSRRGSNSTIVLTYRAVLDGPTLPWPGTTATPVLTNVKLRLDRTEDMYQASLSEDDGVTWKALGKIEQVYQGAVIWGLASAGTGASPGAPVFVSYRDFVQAIGDPFLGVKIRREDDKIILTWWGQATLESAATITGAWIPVPDASSPFSVSATDAYRFYRVQH